MPAGRDEQAHGPDEALPGEFAFRGLQALAVGHAVRARVVAGGGEAHPEVAETAPLGVNDHLKFRSTRRTAYGTGPSYRTGMQGIAQPRREVARPEHPVGALEQHDIAGFEYGGERDGVEGVGGLDEPEPALRFEVVMEPPHPGSDAKDPVDPCA